MAISFDKLRRSIDDTKPPITLIYGVDGIGKTSLAAEFPNPVYLPTKGERPPSDVDIDIPGTLESWADVEAAFGFLLSGEHDYQTVIIDSLDGLAPSIERMTADRIGAASIDDNSKGSPASYGNGMKESEVEWTDFMDGCDALRAAGMFVVLIAHPEIKRFDSPLTDPYDRYQIGINKRAAPLVRSKCDIVAFMNKRVSIKEKEIAPKKSIAHAEGGKEILIHLNEGAGFVAKNRYSMPDSVVYRKGNGFAELSKYFPQSANDTAPTGAATRRKAA
ncbi:MAG: ATP-binding protein [Ferrovibrio sp.]|uniref:ATP-binding protein n=1 Tax=Ferrovibrio sp. TaxID=1917215 RepID=UPI0026343439|nr:ATP-binding protein [Ferrovibrio sp.]MCW0235244.1 ATP-binding protein [Ferrovibrio sp.]